MIRRGVCHHCLPRRAAFARCRSRFPNQSCFCCAITSSLTMMVLTLIQQKLRTHSSLLDLLGGDKRWMVNHFQGPHSHLLHYSSLLLSVEPPLEQKLGRSNVHVTADLQEEADFALCLEPPCKNSCFRLTINSPMRLRWMQSNKNAVVPEGRAKTSVKKNK